MTPKQKAALERGSKIRSLVMLYVTANNLFQQGVYTKDECMSIRYVTDAALERIRGESETAKRDRERLKAYSR